MRLGILSGGTGWHVQDLLRAAEELRIDAIPFDFRFLSHALPAGRFEWDAILVRTMPAGSLEQVIFRMDRLHAAGIPVFNSPHSLETCIDKYRTTAVLAERGFAVPRTWVGEQADDAMAEFTELGGDVVMKPLFGSEGRGMIRLTDPEIAWRTLRAVQQTGGVLYLQEFIRHPGWDLRVFVLGERILGTMKRTAKDGWRTNVAQGGNAERYDLPESMQILALRAARAIGAAIAGVDLIRDERDRWFVLEVNAVPGWKALAPTCGVDVAAEILRFVREQTR